MRQLVSDESTPADKDLFKDVNGAFSLAFLTLQVANKCTDLLYKHHENVVQLRTDQQVPMRQLKSEFLPKMLKVTDIVVVTQIQLYLGAEKVGIQQVDYQPTQQSLEVIDEDEEYKKGAVPEDQKIDVDAFVRE